MLFQHGCSWGFHTWAAGSDESWGVEIPPCKNSTLYTGESGATATRLGKAKNVRAILPPSMLFADRALLCRGYSISEPNA